MQINFLKKALELAKTRKGFCAPNPSVGAIIAEGNRILASGCHFAPGHPHAEIDALQQLSTHDAKTLDLYVTLEPCCHYGKTPPCTEAILKSGIRRVFYGILDPDKRVSGKGISQLERAGIRCEQLDLPEIHDFYQSYIHWQTCQKPFVTAKLAISVDKKIAGLEGKPLKISGPVADTFTHQQRKQADALFTTARTIHRDNPKLNVRLPEETLQKSIYILDRTLSIPLNAQIFSTAASVTLFHDAYVCENKVARYQEKGAMCVAVPDTRHSEQLPWNFIFTEVGKRGVHDLWVEAGARCFHSLVTEQSLQQAYLYYSPKLIGEEGTPAFPEAFNLFLGAKKIEYRMLGTDRMCRVQYICRVD